VRGESGPISDSEHPLIALVSAYRFEAQIMKDVVCVMLAFVGLIAFSAVCARSDLVSLRFARPQATETWHGGQGHQDTNRVGTEAQVTTRAAGLAQRPEPVSRGPPTEQTPAPLASPKGRPRPLYSSTAQLSTLSPEGRCGIV
jgi:hypothetical protein